MSKEYNDRWVKPLVNPPVDAEGNPFPEDPPNAIEVAEAWKNFKPKIPFGYVVAMMRAIRER